MMVLGCDGLAFWRARLFDGRGVLIVIAVAIMPFSGPVMIVR